MALLEIRPCPHCGKSTWQEFIPRGAPSCSYWHCRECGKRHEADQPCVSEGARLYRGRVQTETSCGDVRIMDISRIGARLCCEAECPLPLRVHERVLFNPQMQPYGELSRSIASIVRWIQGLEFGISYERPLSTATNDIKNIVKN